MSCGFKFDKEDHKNHYCHKCKHEIEFISACDMSKACEDCLMGIKCNFEETSQ